MEQAQGNTGSFNAVEYGPGQAARDAEHDALKTDELTEPRALNTDPLTAAASPDNAVMPEPSTDDVITGEFTATEAESDDGSATALSLASRHFMATARQAPNCAKLAAEAIGIQIFKPPAPLSMPASITLYI